MTLPPTRGNTTRRTLVTAKPSEKKRPAIEPKAPKMLPPTVAKNNKILSDSKENPPNPANHTAIPDVISELRKQMNVITPYRHINMRAV